MTVKYASKYVNNIFRLAGDVLHVMAIVLMWLKMSRTRSCSGISLKSQILYMMVYASRYLDLTIAMANVGRLRPMQWYNSGMKILFLGTQSTVLYNMMRRYRATYNPHLDNFRIELLIVPCLLLSLMRAMFVFGFNIIEFFWTFSILLESVAVLPQMFMLHKTGEAETITTHYLFCIGFYRVMYMFNWVYRYLRNNPPELVAVLAGLVQAALYSDFFYIYYQRVFQGRAFKLPL